MSRILPARAAAFIALLIAATLAAPAEAANPAPGPITVKQVLDLFDTLHSDPEAGKLLFAYFSGIGETAGALISSAKNTGGFAGCSKSLTLDGTTAETALRHVRGDSAKIAATPVLIEDMLARAECK